MTGYLNRCPNCDAESNFVLEELECDKALVAWCRSCGEYVSLTTTLETYRKWWGRFYSGEEHTLPPVSLKVVEKLTELEHLLRNDPSCYMDKVEIHFKDFNEYEGDWNDE